VVVLLNFPFNSLFNSSSNVTNLNSFITFFSSVYSHHESKQHSNSVNVFSSPLSSNQSNSLTVDFNLSDTDFKDLILHFAYESNTFSSISSPPPSPNQITDQSTSQEEFKVFSRLSLHVFSSFFSFYYSLH
jgi:hypothetical protein